MEVENLKWKKALIVTDRDLVKIRILAKDKKGSWQLNA